MSHELAEKLEEAVLSERNLYQEFNVDEQE